ncbi:hypothetical protein AKJ18_07890 [Vibrio xuii]|nr:hypothetical protein AKJ18_07890 [Vibrio xuii]
MRKLVAILISILALLGCQDGHIDEDKGAGNKSSGYTPQVITEANSAIFNLVGNDRQTYKTESLARVTTFASDRIMSALGAKNVSDLVSMSEQAFINGTRSKTLSNGDVVDFTVYYVDSSSGHLSLTIRGKSDILTKDAPHLVESEHGLKAANFPTGKIDLFLVVDLDPTESKNSFVTETKDDMYLVVNQLGKTRYEHSNYSNGVSNYINEIVFNRNTSQVRYSIDNEYMYLSYNPSTDTLSQ